MPDEASGALEATSRSQILLHCVQRPHTTVHTDMDGKLLIRTSF
jgi:hypothetical protein